MRILVISAAFPPMQVGEADHTLHLCQHLAGCGADLHVLTTKTNGATNGLPFTLHPIMSEWSWSELPRLARCVRRCSPDAVLLIYIDCIYDDHPMITFTPTIVRTMLPPVRFVTTFENPIGRPPRRLPVHTRILRRFMARVVGKKDVNYRFGTLLRDSHRIIVLSERHRNALANVWSGIGRKCELIPPPPLMRMSHEMNPRAREEVRHKLGVKPEDFVLAYIGRIYPKKGVETLLKALQIASTHTNNVQLIVIGGGVDEKVSTRISYVQDLHESCKTLGIEDRVRWTGEYAAGTDEASVYLRAADACVLPFDHGVQLNNSSLAAAAAHGLPLITTQGNELEAVFVHEENVFLCQPKSPEMLADAITRVKNEPVLRERLCIGARKLADEWYSWSKAIERILSTFS